MGLLSLEDVSYTYAASAQPVLRGITAEFEAGRMYAVIGKSGAGKTTLLSLISGLDLCTQGSIRYRGNDLCNINRDRYRACEIGVVFQGYNLLHGMTATENLVLAMNLGKDKSRGKREAAYKLLERVGIGRETADRKVLKLSGGEQQRTAIARALSHNPDILIADEPTGNLDTDTEREIMGIFLELVKEENRCVILVTHSHQVASYADEVLGISDGRLITVKC